MSSMETYGSVCTHWALGSVVLVALASSEYSGAGTLVALPITATAITFAALCTFSNAEKPTSRHKGWVNVLTFYEIWLNILQNFVAAATCARVASATMDYMSDRRLRHWLFGIESHSLGEPWPDVLGVGIIAIVTVLFMLGLEKSYYFCILLYLTISLSFAFFITVGGYHTDTSFWNWTDDFGERSWACLLTTSAMCGYGFANTFPTALRTKKIKMFMVVLIPVLFYSLTVTVFTLMSHYREVAGIAIPLVRVFEVRDVDWARPIMASLTICVVCLSLTEIMPCLYNLLVKLAGRDWKVLASPILYRSSVTGAPVLAIFTAGSLASILAFACPLAYLVRMLNIAALLKCLLNAMCALCIRYEADAIQDGNAAAAPKTIRYRKLATNRTSNISKSFFDMLPSYLKLTRVTVTTSEVRDHHRKNRKSPSGDKEYLLLDHYSKANMDVMGDEESDSEANDEPITSNCSEGEETESLADIDAAVQEYRERVQATNAKICAFEKQATLLSERIVMTLTILTCLLSGTLALGIIFDRYWCCIATLICLAICLLTICVMPQGEPDPDNLIKSPILFPCVAVIAIIFNAMLATAILLEIWHAILLWIFAGALIYAKCNCCGCIDSDRMHHIHSFSKSDRSSGPLTEAHTSSKVFEVEGILIPT